jgi:acetylornithine deacetylase/succinyl-diaminopimelate desuccinylase-like protein
MTGWEALLERLAETPRENGSAALHQTATFLSEVLEREGADVELLAFTAHPYALRLAGVVALAGALLYVRCVRARRPGAALAVAVLVPALLLAQLDYQLPVFAWVDAQTQHHVRVRIPVESPTQRLLLTAHYDTKTDALDHVQRAPIDFLALAAVALMILGAVALGLGPRWPRRRRLLGGVAGAAAAGAALCGVASFLALSAGAFLPKRSPGALDDGGACAVLVRLASVLTRAPPLERTEVEILLFSAEEVGVQGSREFARRRFGSEPELPTRVVNLEGLGASADHAVLGRERFALRSFPPDADLVGLLDAVHREQFAKPLEVTAHGGATDARSFLARGIPAATLITRAAGPRFTRGLHSWRDDRSRLDQRSLEASLAYLESAVRAIDRGGP